MKDVIFGGERVKIGEESPVTEKTIVREKLS